MNCTNCGNPRAPRQNAHGWCTACYHRWYRAGKPQDGPPPPRAADRARREDYQFLRAQGLSPDDAARRLGLHWHGATDHERRWQHARQHATSR